MAHNKEREVVIPCDTVSTTNVEIGAKIDAGSLHAALAALGLSPRQLVNGSIYFSGGQYVAGQLTLQGSNVEARTAEIKRAYMAEGVKSTAAKAGWQVKPVGKYQYKLVKRSV